jgi:K+-transporting ATPase ATPase C chain
MTQLQSLQKHSLQDHVGLRGPVVFAGVILVGFGLLYSLAGTVAGGVLFPVAAHGSVIEANGQVVGSSLVAQPFGDARYFQPRPSAAGYDPMAAAGSNMARSNPDLRKRIDETRAAVAARDGVAPADVPADLLTQSGGGLDPDISPAAARQQVARVSRVRGLPIGSVEGLVDTHTRAPQFGMLGEPRVNVLELNLALDALQTTR